MTGQRTDPVRVLILARYGSRAASTRYRLLQYLPYLERHGFTFSINTLLDDDYILSLYSGQKTNQRRIAAAYVQRVSELARARRFDLIWMHIEAFPWVPSWWERLVLPRGVPYVIDLDDAMYHRYDKHNSSLVRAVLGKKIDHMMEGASLVVAGNQYIADRAYVTGVQEVSILPTVVDLDRYRIKQVPSRHRPETVVGWIGSPATAYNIQFMRHAIETLSAEQAIRLVTVGSGDVDMGPRINLDARRWSEATEVNDIQSFDIGTMPLVDSSFERGKSGFKLIQCMACGIPVVASPVGANAEIVTHGVNGFLASSSDDWLAALKVLAGDPQLRQEMGSAGRALVEQGYSLQQTAPKLAALLRAAAR
jgi:glycosyltransferase involved in cell wall biosynthesis